MSSPIVFILGAGPRIAQHTAQRFSAAGYKIALAARSLDHLQTNDAGHLQVKLDLSKPETVPEAFATVESKLGAPPSVVIYNAAHATFLQEDEPLAGIEAAEFQTSLAINTISPTIAAKHAVAGFAKLPASAARVYIYTGNLLNESPWPRMLTIGAGKAAMANTIEGLTAAYKEKGYRFYYADERKADGGTLLNEINGDAHADAFWELAEDKAQRDWEYTFVRGVGYKRFTKEDVAFWWRK